MIDFNNTLELTEFIIGLTILTIAAALIWYYMDSKRYSKKLERLAKERALERAQATTQPQPQATERNIMRQLAKTAQEISSVSKISFTRVLVFEVSGDIFRAYNCRVSSDGFLVDSKAQKSWLPPADVRPTIIISRGFRGYRATAAYFVDPSGRFLSLESNGDAKLLAQLRGLSPDLAYSIYNSKFFKKIAAHFSMDPMYMLMGMGFGAMLAFMFITVILPIIGIPVIIGKGIEVTIQQPVQVNTNTLPPPGNYTIPLK
jgi:hypothetical protein